MLPKTFSQKTARIFEIVDYILLAPAAFGVLIATMFIGGAPAFTLIVWAIAALGVALLVGYFKHSRGRLAAEKVRALWIGTLLYNSIPFLGAFYYIHTYYSLGFLSMFYGGWGMFWAGLVVWWGVAVFVPAGVLYKNRRAARTMP